MVTKTEESRYSIKDVNFGDNLLKHDWARGCGMNLPRMRRPEDPSATAGLMTEVWSSIASWLMKPDGNNPLLTCSPNNGVTNSPSSNANKSNCRISSEVSLSFGHANWTAVRCTVPGCNCDCFAPGKLNIRYCEGCSHSWVPHALDKLGFRHIFGQAPVEPVQPNVVLYIASLVLYGCQALPIRLKILLDRLLSVLPLDEVTQILREFGWSHEDYVRGYILQEAHGIVLDRWNICTPEEEPLVLQQFLRFGETRTITQQLLMHGIGDLRNLPRIEADFKKMVEKSITKGLASSKTEESSRSKSSLLTASYSTHKLRSRDGSTTSPTSLPSPLLPPPPHIAGKFPSSLIPPHTHPATTLHHSVSASQSHQSSKQLQHQQQQSLNLVKLPQTGLTCTPITTVLNGPVSSSSSNSPPITTSSRTPTVSMNLSPLNKLQKMQPFDYRQIASGIFQSSKSAPPLPPLQHPPFAVNERRRPSETSDTSQSGLNLCVTNPSTSLPQHQPMPIPPTPSVYSSNVGCKSPLVDFSISKGSSEFGSEAGGDDDDEDSGHNALNLSKDAGPRFSKQRHGHSRKTSTPMKRQWGSSNLPLNLGTQLINPATGKKRVQCNVCLKTFCDKGALKIHFSAVHLREMHKCTVEGCNMMFSSRRSRNRHSANPNPKLHSPHLRRKISPHDGRSSQAHPLILPPLQGSLNPLAFGTFPLLTPPDLRHSLSGIDLKQGFDFGGMKGGLRFDGHDDYMDYDDEEGIVVDGCGVDDDENDSETNSGEKADSTKSKRTKMSESDLEDGASNTDSNGSIVLSDHKPLKEEHESRSKVPRKRKNQKPTRCPMKPVSTDDEQLSDAYSDEMIFDGSKAGLPEVAEAPKLEQEKEWDLRKTAIKVAKSDADRQKSEEIEKECEADGGHRCLNLIKSNEAMKTEATVEKPNEELPSERLTGGGDGKMEADDEEPINFAGDAEVSSPTRSSGHNSYGEAGGSIGSCDSDENSEMYDDGSEGEVPLDKNNPRKCTACSKVFQNHFGVKTHFQNVHLKLMHKCVVDGCNAAFPSKRSRDRHSANLNLHRKLLSTSDSSPSSPFTPATPEEQCLNSTPTNCGNGTSLPNDFLSRLYADGQGLCPPISATSPKTTNGELISSHHSLMMAPLPGLPFAGLNPYTPTSHLPMLNGKPENAAISPSKSSPRLYAYNVEEDMPTPDQDNVYHCRFCSKPYHELVSLKDHYEKNHLNEMFKCKVLGCNQVFSSRTKRNIHSENRLLHNKELSTS